MCYSFTLETLRNKECRKADNFHQFDTCSVESNGLLHKLSTLDNMANSNLCCMDKGSTPLDIVYTKSNPQSLNLQ